MLKPAFPAVSLPRDDYVRLMRLARRARLLHHPVAEFLLAEVCRAKITDGASERQAVRLNARVVYQIDNGKPECRVLVHPDDYALPEQHISVLSPVGVALIGIRAGDRMPFLGTDGTLRFVTVVSVEPPALAPAEVDTTEAQFPPDDDPPDSGPHAA
ncbi:MAG TPA: GreA/GreB family elongation factor [Xanthobacteraceae bacterium]|jgi:transcription elongation GreA/GreB family factor|nr:GreA/GreB family elongation factor [Xanthobacteraceae bacterium]